MVGGTRQQREHRRRRRYRGAQERTIRRQDGPPQGPHTRTVHAQDLQALQQGAQVDSRHCAQGFARDARRSLECLSFLPHCYQCNNILYLSTNYFMISCLLSIYHLSRIRTI